jgi:hypothetical protein
VGQVVTSRKAKGVVSYARCTSWNTKRPWRALCRIRCVIVHLLRVLMSYRAASLNLHCPFSESDYTKPNDE